MAIGKIYQQEPNNIIIIYNDNFNFRISQKKIYELSIVTPPDMQSCYYAETALFYDGVLIYNENWNELKKKEIDIFYKNILVKRFIFFIE